MRPAESVACRTRVSRDDSAATIRAVRRSGLTPAPAITELLEEHFVRAVLKQARLGEVLDDATWHADLDAARLRIGGRTVALDIIASESRVARTLVWGWANPSIPDGLAVASRQLRELGHERAVRELVEDSELSLDAVDAYAASLIAVGVADLEGYFLGANDDVRLAFAIRDDEVRDLPLRIWRLGFVLHEAAAELPIDHRRAFEHYVASPLPGVEAEAGADLVVLRATDGIVTIGFDRHGRMTKIESDLAGR